MLAKLTSKNQLALPKSITQALVPAEYVDVQAGDEQIVLTPVRNQRGHARQELLADYLPHTLVIAITGPPPAVSTCRDAFDMPLLHLALAGRVDALVSGDADLLALAGQLRFSIAAPEDFPKTSPALPT